MTKLSMAIIRKWLPFAFIATAFCGLVYLAVQQSYRQSANDPQIAMAEDVAMAFSNGSTSTPVLASGNVDIAESLSPYVVLYDDTGTPIAGSGMLDGALPKLPAGIFDYTRSKGEDRLTWQPRSGVRSAIVVVRVSGSRPGFIMVGRSLREVEIRVEQLEIMVASVWMASLLGTLILCLL